MLILKKLFGQNQVGQILFLILLFALITNGFSYIDWPLKGSKTLQKVISISMLVVIPLLGKPAIYQHFRTYVLLLTFLPFVSVLYSYTEYNQPIFDGIKATLPSLMWLFYFVLHRIKIQEGSIMVTFFYIALFAVAVQVIQQFTYPTVLFGVHIEDELDPDKEIAQNRNGLWRFPVSFNGYFTAITLFALWLKNKSKPSTVTLFFVLLMFISIYLTLTRQVLFATIFTFFASFFMYKEKVKAWWVILAFSVIGVAFVYSDLLFGAFVDMTLDDANEHNIRLIAAQYYISETFSSLKAALLGHGVAFSGYFYNLSMDLRESYHFYLSDVGFIGIMWKFGIPYVLLCYTVLYKLFWGWGKIIPPHIRLFVMFTTIMSVMIFPMTRGTNYIIWSLILYMSDIYINQALYDKYCYEVEKDFDLPSSNQFTQMKKNVRAPKFFNRYKRRKVKYDRR